jgi:hypothetical protein
MQSLLQIL